MIPSAVSLPLREMKDALGGTGEGDFYEVSSESGVAFWPRGQS